MVITDAIRYRGFFLDCELVKQGSACCVAQFIITHKSGAALDEYAFHEHDGEALADALSPAKAWGEWFGERLQEADACAGLGVHSV